ncbi:hypothetical protein ACTFQ5_15790 [Aliivibrio fischeri]|uniref:hypothetical protein n=1 Tax=Aliivibrio fischeri TaxID=668 RepID=UPI0007C58B62|nr:hypothetical protein [Aliivibrio fischeri]MBP3140112.1 hypothetical protein [Aliivibrio fischeri]OCH05909.1 hypothetical protein A6E10_07535 [Aliivibrio fischeri]OCH27475.1 hypothetical protein A6E13_06930 [Aliivibrio fischeri]OCH62548.1 hypothetical protein A6D98_05985 [Aliivibrio fischeri]
MLSFQVVITAPFMTLDEYSRHSGMTKRTLKDWAAQGKLILKKKDLPKETPLVNVIAMQELATREALSYLG